MSMNIIILCVVIGCVAFTILAQNRLVSLRNRLKNAFSQIDVQLKRRYDLIPNLVETARAYMVHERETLTAVTNARNHAATAREAMKRQPENADNLQSLIAAEMALNSSMGRFFAVSENYPELRSDVTMLQVMEELSSTENRIAFARQHYNDCVMGYNSYREQFPQSTLANAFGFREAAFFQLDTPEARKGVTISFR